ncbi:MAG TPA: hypothetical protein DDW52_30170 [Planctomycetaceae bacterium]|nr:hypothetical protein [Planctomycetaceae bacterium]
MMQGRNRLSNEPEHASTLPFRAGVERVSGQVACFVRDPNLRDRLGNAAEEAGCKMTVIHQIDACLPMLGRTSTDVFVMEYIPPDLRPLSTTAAIRCNAALDRVSLWLLVPPESRTEMLELECLASGADVVLQTTIPVELMSARLGATVNARSRVGTEASAWSIGELKIDHRQRRAWACERELALTPTEYQVLHSLMQNPGEICDRSVLIGQEAGNDPLVSPRTVDVHVYALRQKLGFLGPMIRTVKGEGYMIQEKSA